METARYLECLHADAARLRDVAGKDLSPPVPSCPGWTVTDLVRHVAETYLHKTEIMRRGEIPRPWPPDLSGEPPLGAFDRAYRGLRTELTTRPPGEPTPTWFTPDQTVGFWIRRMAQESVIHRVDAELALGSPLAPIPDDLATDGVDEVLERFLGYGSREWAEGIGDDLSSCDGRSVLVTAGGHAWLVRLAPDGVDVTAQADPAVMAPPAAVGGTPAEVLLWLWRRAGDERVRLDGDVALIGRLRQLLGDVTG